MNPCTLRTAKRCRAETRNDLGIAQFLIHSEAVQTSLCCGKIGQTEKGKRFWKQDRVNKILLHRFMNSYHTHFTPKHSAFHARCVAFPLSEGERSEFGSMPHVHFRSVASQLSEPNSVIHGAPFMSKSTPNSMDSNWASFGTKRMSKPRCSTKS